MGAAPLCCANLNPSQRGPLCAHGVATVKQRVDPLPGWLGKCDPNI